MRTITLTQGEAGYPYSPICRKEDLKLIREAELRRYGFVLGVDYQELWDVPDGELGTAPEDEIVDRLVARVRQWTPDLTLTFDPSGGYSGHPDHKATGRFTTRAVSLAADGDYKPESGVPHRPKRLLYVVAPRRALRMFGDATLREVASVQPAPTLAVPTDKGKKLAGWGLHASQHLEKAYPLPGWLLFDFFDKEHYVALDPTASTIK